MDLEAELLSSEHFILDFLISHPVIPIVGIGERDCWQNGVKNSFIRPTLLNTYNHLTHFWADTALNKASMSLTQINMLP